MKAQLGFTGIALPLLYLGGVDRRIILKWIFKVWDGEAWTELIWFRIGTGDCRKFLVGF